MKNLILLSIVLSFAFFSCTPKPERKQQSDVEANTIDKSVDYYQEAHRPQFHFSPETQWMNDPNGMVYHDGEYHLFYQYYPDSNVWGPMHWGHAISEDLVHWEHLPIALYPDDLGYIFSGSAIIDWENTSGFGKDGIPPMIAIYTYHDPVGEKADQIDFQYQGIAYSTDKGRTWTKYENNPVIPNPGIRDFRDPKVIWDQESKQWVMVFAAKDRVQFYGSADLKKWTFLSEFGAEWGTHRGVWECPDLFPLKVDEGEEEKWALLVSINPGGPNGGSATQYFVGDFDGSNFNLDPEFAKALGKNDESKAVWLEYGRDNYAGVTWSDVPEEDGRRIFIGWMSNWDYAQVVPTYVWRSTMTIPRELQLKNTPAGLRLFSIPVKELEALRGAAHAPMPQDLAGTLDLTERLGEGPGLFELRLSLATPVSSGAGVILEFSNSKNETYRIGYDADKQQFFSDRRQAGKNDFSEKFASDIHYASRISDAQELDLHLFVDVSSVELFADGGSTVLTDLFFPSEPFSQLKIVSGEGMLEIKQVMLYRLNSIWQ